jgi:hypothetical protein
MSIKQYIIFTFIFFHSVSIGQKIINATEINFESIPEFDTIKLSVYNFEENTFIVAGKFEISFSARPFINYYDSVIDDSLLKCGLLKNYDAFKSAAVIKRNARYATLSFGDYKKYCDCPKLEPHKILLNEILNGRINIIYDAKEIKSESIILIKKMNKKSGVIYLKTLTGKTILKIKKRKCT